jgi:hypothetical protein
MKNLKLLTAFMLLMAFGMLFAGCSFKTSIDAKINNPFSSSSDGKFKTQSADCVN